MLDFEEHNILVIDPLARTAQPVSQFECESKILKRLVALEEYNKYWSAKDEGEKVW